MATRPSGRLFAEPRSPSSPARRRVQSRKPLPCTRPCTHAVRRTSSPGRSSTIRPPKQTVAPAGDSAGPALRRRRALRARRTLVLVRDLIDEIVAAGCDQPVDLSDVMVVIGAVGGHPGPPLLRCRPGQAAATQSESPAHVSKWFQDSCDDKLRAQSPAPNRLHSTACTQPPAKGGSTSTIAPS